MKNRHITGRVVKIENGDNCGSIIHLDNSFHFGFPPPCRIKVGQDIIVFETTDERITVIWGQNKKKIGESSIISRWFYEGVIHYCNCNHDQVWEKSAQRTSTPTTQGGA